MVVRLTSVAQCFLPNFLSESPVKPIEEVAALPADTDVLVIGAGITGLYASHQFWKSGRRIILLEKSSKIGGVWTSQANVWSRVNTSEPAYRPRHETDTKNVSMTRSLHPSTADIMSALNDVTATGLKECIHLQVIVSGVVKVQDLNAFDVHYHDKKSGHRSCIRASIVLVCVNRRIGKLRIVDLPGEAKFCGKIAYGVNNEINGVDFAGRSVLIIGAGAFASENARNAVECGARKVVVLSRRRGTVMPLLLDY